MFQRINSKKHFEKLSPYYLRKTGLYSEARAYFRKDKVRDFEIRGLEMKW